MRTEKITTEEIKEIAKKLPKPISVYYSPKAKFIIYKAKEIYKKKWLDQNLKKLVLESRRTYLRYGSRELLDVYDAKAVIYLIQVIYKKENFPIEEWFSCRMSPGDGTPLGGGELEIHFHKNKPLDFWVKHKLLAADKNFWASIVSHSRMCGIHPYFSSSLKPFDLDIKHNYTPHCFALVHRAFKEDYHHNKNYKYYTGIIRDDFARRGLTLKIGNKIYGPAFQSASQILNIPKNKIVMNRQIYAYAFPLYWLNLDDLKKIIYEAIRKQYLSLESLHYYLDTHLSLQSIFSSKLNNPLSRLGDLLTVNGKIKGGRITGAEFRKIIDRRVKDAPELKISEMKQWNDSTDNFLKMANISKIK